MKDLLKNSKIILPILLVPLWTGFALGKVNDNFSQFIVLLSSILFFITFYLLFERNNLGRKIQNLAKKYKVKRKSEYFASYSKVTEDLFSEIERIEKSFSTNLLNEKIKDKQELNQVLESMVKAAYRQLNAESAELSLFDEKSKLYHSSFVMGKPFKIGAQAMLAESSTSSKDFLTDDILIQPISFAGSVLGTLRVALKDGSFASPTDKKIIQILALNTSIAIINTEFNEQLLKMHEQSEEAMRAKTGFLANLSHEIRAPLGMIINAVELLIEGLCGEMNEEQIDTAQIIKNNGTHLLELINDVLDYAKAEAGKIVPNVEAIDVNELLSDVTRVVRSLADEKNHKLVFKMNDEALAINCDRRHIRQMLINLLTNAIKYTPNGGEVDISVEKIPKINKIKISVKDTGVGIKKSDFNKVFSAFQRLDHSYSVKQAGTGLGLSLTKKLAEYNNGSIQFNSKIGEGTHFWLTFPSVSFQEIISKNVPQGKENKGKGETVVLGIYNNDEAELTRKYLRKNGYRAAEARTWEQVLKLVSTEKPALLIIDNEILESSEKTELLFKLRSQYESAKLPVLLLTSKAFEFDVEGYLKDGADLCLSKPAPLPMILKACRALIDGEIDEAFLKLESDWDNSDVLH